MDEVRRAGVIVGLLFIVATAFLFLGEAFYRAHLEAPDVLFSAQAHRGAITFGLLLELICILAMPLIGAFIYPVLAQVSPGMALSYFFFRALEAVILIAVALSNKFSLLSLSAAVTAGADRQAAEASLALIRAQNVWANTDGVLYNVIFICGALCLYGVLFRARMIPRWISVWGILAIAVLAALVLMDLFGGPLPGWAALLLVPIALQEMVMAFWFILCGFDMTGCRGPVAGHR